MTAELRLAVFDLDYTIWKPEMYQIHGPPKLKTKNGKQTVTDRSNTPITIFEGASYALAHIHKLREVHSMDIEAAIASRTDEPSWAQNCMDWLTVQNDNGSYMTLTSYFPHVEIGFSDKKKHFQNLRKKTGIEYESIF